MCHIRNRKCLFLTDAVTLASGSLKIYKYTAAGDRMLTNDWSGLLMVPYPEE